MASHLIVGAGASGLYTAYKLLKSGKLHSSDTVTVCEWGERVGGRIFTYNFTEPEEWKEQGVYVELGGMRFAADAAFPNLPSTKCEGHVLVQSMILELGLQAKVRDFQQSRNRLYYLRGRNVYEDNLTPAAMHQLPYGFNKQFFDFINQIPQQPNPNPITADNVLGQIGLNFTPNLGSSNALREKWCEYFSAGTVPTSLGTPAFPTGTPIYDVGYWNLLYDQLGDEGFDYSADGTGYTSNVINWNAADAMQANNDYSSTTQYKRLDGGYGQLFDAMAESIEKLGGQIQHGKRLVSLEESLDGTQTYCTFDGKDGKKEVLTADYLFLAMPRRSLELVAHGCAPTYMLNQADVKLWLESSIDQPAIKAIMVFDEAWWTSPHCAYPPNLVWPTDAPQPAPPVAQQVGGATITDLPLRMIYYFGNNIPNGPGNTGGPYVLLASYDDMNYSDFWRQVEACGEYTKAPSLSFQPLRGPTKVDPMSSFAQLLRKQLAELHGIDLDKVPLPRAVYFQDWGQDPYGGGYHGWAAHYNICKAMDFVRAPYANILSRPATKTFIIGSCYSFDQAWVEGAFCTAQSVLEEFFGFPEDKYSAGYQLVCLQAN